MEESAIDETFTARTPFGINLATGAAAVVAAAAFAAVAFPEAPARLAVTALTVAGYATAVPTSAPTRPSPPWRICCSMASW